MVGGMLFADNYIGVSDQKEFLQMLCMLRYCSRQRLSNEMECGDGVF